MRSELPDAKRELSDETETLKTQEPCPDTVPASCACCLIINEVMRDFILTAKKVFSIKNYLHIINLDLPVI